MVEQVCILFKNIPGRAGYRGVEHHIQPGKMAIVFDGTLSANDEV